VAGSGPLVLFVHGVGGNRHHWDEQLKYLAQEFKAAAWDARGYGDSGDYDGPLDFEKDFCADVLRVLEHFGEKKLHLVGLSMGGRIARNFALRHPDRLHSVTLANTSAGIDAMTPEQVAKFVEERRNRTPESVRALMGSRARPEAMEVLRQSVMALHRPMYLKTLEAIVAQDRRAPVEKISLPALVIAGDEDTVYPKGSTRSLAERIPGAQFVEFKGCGHLSNLEQPEEFNRVLLEFLRRHK
jgi:3-oxoadipate enol-lactonase